MDKLSSLLLFFVENFPRALTRTELVKLVYLTDIEYYRLYGTSLSGVKFIRDYFGPNSAVVTRAAIRLGEQGFIRISETPNAYGNVTYYHYPARGERSYALSLREEDAARFVIEMTRGLTLKGIKKVAYDTAPMRILRETESREGYELFGEEMDFTTLAPNRRKRSLKVLRTAFSKIDLSTRGSLEDYSAVIAKEAEELRPFRERAMETEALRK